MKLTLFILLLTFSAFGQSLKPKENAELKTTYDKFKNISGISTEAFIVRPAGQYPAIVHAAECSASYIFDGPEVKGSIGTYFLVFHVRAGDWLYLERSRRDLILIADGERIQISGPANHNGDTTTAYGKVETRETLIMHITRAQLESIAKAKSSEYQLGFLESSFTESDKKSIQQLLDATKLAK